MSGLSIDVVIRGGQVVDGTGNPWFHGDVALGGDRVLAVAPAGTLPTAGVRDVVDAQGMVVCPGFIDIQSHSIIPLMVDGRCLSKIMQGVTTEIMGEAWTPAPLGGLNTTPLRHSPYPGLEAWRERAKGWARFRDWLEAVQAAGVSPNIGSFLGGGTLRTYAKGMAMGAATPDEVATMRRVLAEAMDDGAFGVSFALIYPPDAYVATDELIAVCQAMAPMGGVYITHVRSEANGLLEGIEEALAIGRAAGVAVEIYHLKAAGRSNWHKMPQVLATIDNARASGLDVTADMYPYVASGTGLTSVLPTWVAADGELFDNLRDPATRARVREEVLHPSGEWEAMGRETTPEGIMPVGFERPENKQYAGQRLSAIAAARGQDWIDAAIDLLVSEEQRISTIYFMMSEENVKLQLQQPWIKISTDAGGLDPAWAAPHGPVHPRAYGTYPRVIGSYVREERVLGLEDAIRKMTSAVADRLGLRERGLLRAGCFADVVVFDPATMADRATFEAPHQLPVGVRDVWVNGTRVVADSAHTGSTPGRFVAGPGRR